MPPFAFTDADPLEEPQVAGVVLVVAVMAAGSLMNTAALLIQPFASVIVTVYTPAARPVITWVF